MALLSAWPNWARMAPASATTESVAACRTGHVPALDGIRGLAILMVMSYHIFPAEPMPQQALLRIGYAAAAVGWTGVDLFFVLSGFLITGILYDVKGSRRYFLNFYGRRALRIFPLYFGFALVLIELVPRLLGFRVTGFSWLTLGTFSANFQMASGDAGMLGHYWSLAIEEQFYLVWPLFVFAMSRATLMRVCVAVMVISAALRWVVASQGISPHMFTSCRIDTLLVGALLALSTRGPMGTSRVARRAIMVSLAAAVAATLFYAALGGSGSAWLQVVKYPLIAAPCAALLAVGVTASPGSPIDRILTLRPLCHLGRYSYGLYVYHQAIIDILRWLIGPAGGVAASNLAFRVVLFVCASYAIAWASWHAFERPLLSLKRHFEYAPSEQRTSRSGSDRHRATDVGSERSVARRPARGIRWATVVEE